jgi:hypothetical protein
MVAACGLLEKGCRHLQREIPDFSYCRFKYRSPADFCKSSLSKANLLIFILRNWFCSQL